MKKIVYVLFLVLVWFNVSFAADTNLTAMTEDTSPTADDLFYMVNDPAGTPAPRRVTFSNLLKVGVVTQAYSAVLDTYAGIDPSANVQSLLAAANFAAFMALLDGTDRTWTGALDATGASSFDIGPLTLSVGSGSIVDGALRNLTSPTGLAGNVLGIGNGLAQEYILQYLTLPTADGQFLVYDETSDLWVPKVMSNDVTMDELGAVTLSTSSQVVNTITSFASPTTANPYTLTAANSYNAVVYYGATGEIDIPALVDGMAVLIYNTGAFTITIDPNASEAVVRDGILQTGGVSFTLSSGAGNFVCIVSDGTNWVTKGFKGTLLEGT